MKTRLTTLSTLILLMPLAPVRAGDQAGKETCPQNAATCAQMMKEKFSERGWVGINMDFDEEHHAVVITNVMDDSPAERAGFEVGDVLRGLNGVDYSEENKKALEAEYASFKPGNEVKFTIERDGETVNITVLLEKIPQPILAQWIGQHILEYHQGEAEVAEVDSDTSSDSP